MNINCPHCGNTIEIEKATAGEKISSYLCNVCDGVIKLGAVKQFGENVPEKIEIRYPHRRILIVEDSRSTSQMLKDFLEEAGFEAHTVSSGEELLKVIKEIRPELVLLDLKLPGMSGFDVLREINRMPECQNIVFLAMSAVYRDPSNIRLLRELGARGFVDKDNIFNTVLERIHSLLAA